MVRNEVDVIGATVRHLLDQGVERILIADNGSDDGTRDVLSDLARDLPVTVMDDREPAYHQSVKMTRLANAARRSGARWVVPFDADELWFAEEGSLGEFLAQSCEARLEAKVHNAYPDRARDGLFHVDITPEDIGKTAFRPLPGNTVLIGNHFVDRPGRSGAGLRIVHLPWRSKSQMARKAAAGSLALRLAGHEERLGSQWRALGDAQDSLVDEAWESVIARTPLAALNMKAAGPFVETDLFQIRGGNFMAQVLQHTPRELDARRGAGMQ